VHSAPTSSSDWSTLAELIRYRSSNSPDAVYLEDARSDRSLSYGRFAGLIEAWGRLFDSLGLEPSSAVVIDIADPLSFAVAHLAVVSSGRRSVPVDPGMSPADVARISTLLGGAALLVTDNESAGRLPAVARVGVDPDTFVPVGFSSADTEPGPVLEPLGEGSAVLFTSGSTGQPKGVELPEKQLLFVATGIAAHNGLTAADRGYNPLPLFHVNAEVVGLLSTLVAGSALVLDRRFQRTGFWELLRERRITWLNAVPAMLAILARGGSIEAAADLRFIRSASAPLPDAVREAIGSIPLVVSYGMTEAASQITATPIGSNDARKGSVGLPVGGEVQVRDEDGKALPIDEVGAVWIRGDGVVKKYFLGAASDRFDAEGWLATGDLGFLDEDGFVSLVGRSDDVINRGGEKVYPSEVEDVLLQDDRVREAVVVARADEILHSVPIAYVIPAEAEITDDERLQLIADLGDRCERELPRFKRPVEISIVADVPRAPTGKIQRRKVRELAADQGIPSL
jgi:acyl-CoA synthetase (AMP-forming)/AMP-acid ligase II